jgi:thiol-disulfide isomerase/thioredoxin
LPGPGRFSAKTAPGQARAATLGVVAASVKPAPVKTEMRTIPNQVAALIAAFAGGTALSQGAEITLKVGDPAPKLQVGKWVQGDPVKGFQKDKVYIVEFWATWCGPCRVSIPHLNEVYEKFKDKGLVVIGQDVWERDEALVAPFVKKMGDKMTYRVALDLKKEEEDKGRMAETWMQAAGLNGIPAAFVVDKAGKVAWIGHPMELKDKLIEEVLAGTFDVTKAAAAYAKKKESDEKMRSLFQRFGRAMQQKDWDKAESALKDIESALPEDERDTPQLSMMRFNLLLAKKDVAAAENIVRKLSDANKDNGMLQNELAWQLVTSKSIEKPNLELADLIATRANEAAKGKDGAILDTLARVKFLKGEKEKAIELQTKAVSLSEGAMKKQLEEILDSYKEGKLPKAGGEADEEK